MEESNPHPNTWKRENKNPQIIQLSLTPSQVKDLGKPELSPESLASVTIYVTDVNDCAPEFEYTDYNVTLYLPTYENVVIEQVKANDPDSSENSTLRYDIIEGNSAGVFAIDSTTGIITTR